MKAGEKFVLVSIGLLVLFSVVRSELHVEEKHDNDIPFYSTASYDDARSAMDVIRKNNCKNCHSLWTLKDMLESVPAPMLDGIGSLRTQDWFYNYLSSPDPQKILPTRLKKEYGMPSYASLPEADRRLLAKYLSSLKVKDWYLEQTKEAEYKKLTGLEYKK